MKINGFGGDVPILGPKDPTPRPDKYRDYMDYRGVAEEHELKLLANGVVSLGRYLEPHGKQGCELFLPADVFRRHSYVIGRPGSGKTEGLVIPWVINLLKRGYSVVTIDVLGNLVGRLEKATQSIGCRFWYWNSDSAISQSWNWLNEVQPSNSQDIEGVVLSILGRRNPSDPQPFFYDRDCRWLRALIAITKTLYAHTATPRYVYSLAAHQDALIDLFRQYPKIQGYAVDVADLLNFSPEEHSRQISGLLNALSFFNQASVVKVTERSDFRLSDIDTQPTLLVIGDSLGNERAAKLSSLILNQLFNHVYRRNKAGLGRRVPMSLIIDEAPRLNNRLNYEEILAVARNPDVGICLVAQDVSQFGNEREAAKILNNCNTGIVLKGVSPETAEFLSKQFKKRREQKVNVLRQRGLADDFRDLDEGKSLLEIMLKNLIPNPTSIDNIEVPVLGEREIMYPPRGRYPATVLSTPITNKPFLVDLDLGRRTI